MNSTIPLGAFDLAVFAVYMVVTVVLGFLVAGRHRKTAKGYFLGDRRLPWYVVATSMIAADISSDDLIANAGGAYQYGIVLGAGSWNAWIIYSLLIWIFLPYYVRSGIFTMPQFLERRYNSACRYIFAVALIVGYVAAILGGTLAAGSHFTKAGSRAVINTSPEPFSSVGCPGASTGAVPKRPPRTLPAPPSQAGPAARPRAATGRSRRGRHASMALTSPSPDGAISATGAAR
jgi:hypothetical protein